MYHRQGEHQSKSYKWTLPYPIVAYVGSNLIFEMASVPRIAARWWIIISWLISIRSFILTPRWVSTIWTFLLVRWRARRPLLVFMPLTLSPRLEVLRRTLLMQRVLVTMIVLELEWLVFKIIVLVYLDFWVHLLSLLLVIASSVVLFNSVSRPWTLYETSLSLH